MELVWKPLGGGLPILDDMGINVELVSEMERRSYVTSKWIPNKTCFMGDGHFDAQVFELVGYSIAPNNAVPAAKEKANYVTKSCGGDGAVYEAALHLLSIRNHEE